MPRGGREKGVVEVADQPTPEGSAAEGGQKQWRGGEGCWAAAAGCLATRRRLKRVGSGSKMALRIAAPTTHEVACRSRRSDRGMPLRDREDGGGLPKNAASKRAWRVVDVRDGPGR